MAYYVARYVIEVQTPSMDLWSTMADARSEQCAKAIAARYHVARVRQVAAIRLQPGDIITVTTAHGARIMGRVEKGPRGSKRLVLKECPLVPYGFLIPRFVIEGICGEFSKVDLFLMGK